VGREPEMQWNTTFKGYHRVERLLLAVGVSLLSFYALARIEGAFSSHAELHRFWEDQKAAANSTAEMDLAHYQSPDVRLWSQHRISAYQEATRSAAPAPLAVLRIPSIHLVVPILEGTDDFTLNRAVGHIEGTPEPGQNGNVCIAGHRDGFFRVLKDIHQGDSIELITLNQNIRYVVDELLIVSPQDISVLQPRPNASLTLVTCYPFYFVGSAPQRFIVHASMAHLAELPAKL
jgi:sortase A